MAPGTLVGEELGLQGTAVPYLRSTAASEYFSELFSVEANYLFYLHSILGVVVHRLLLLLLLHISIVLLILLLTWVASRRGLWGSSMMASTCRGRSSIMLLLLMVAR